MPAKVCCWTFNTVGILMGKRWLSVENITEVFGNVVRRSVQMTDSTISQHLADLDTSYSLFMGILYKICRNFNIVAIDLGSLCPAGEKTSSESSIRLYH